jgi:insulysin
MKVVLISDPLADKSAASVEVQVGSLMDPDDFKGTAKFL